MKKIVSTLLFIGCFITLWAQNKAQDNINEALKLINQKQEKQAMFTLQQAILQLNKVVCTDLAKVLPSNIYDMAANKDTTGASYFKCGDMFFSRHYGGDCQNEPCADVTIAYNSPSAPVFDDNFFYSMTDATKIDVGTRPALLGGYLAETSIGNMLYHGILHLPVNQHMIIISATLGDDEKDFPALYQLVPIDNIIKVLEK